MNRSTGGDSGREEIVGGEGVTGGEMSRRCA